MGGKGAKSYFHLATERVKIHYSHVAHERYEKILNLLMQYEDLFDGTLGDLYTELV